MVRKFNKFLARHFYDIEAIGQILIVFLSGILFAVSIMSLMN